MGSRRTRHAGRSVLGKTLGLQSDTMGLIPGLAPHGCVTLGKTLDLSELQFLPLPNGAHSAGDRSLVGTELVTVHKRLGMQRVLTNSGNRDNSTPKEPGSGFRNFSPNLGRGFGVSPFPLVWTLAGKRDVDASQCLCHHPGKRGSPLGSLAGSPAAHRPV